MKKIFLVVLTCLFLSSCSNIKSIELNMDSSKSVASYPDKAVYVANRSSQTYHLPTCHIAERISEENRFEVYDESFFIERGVSPCKVCKPGAKGNNRN